MAMEEFKQLLDTINQNLQLVPTVYNDVAQPGVKKVGKALETVLDVTNTILLPLKLLNEKTRLRFEKHMNNYREKIKDIPDEKVCDVPPEIGVPIIDKLTYTTNDEIADLFINLLTKASSTDTVSEAHPSFISLIEKLSPDEAKIIKFIKNKDFIPFFRFKINTIDNKGYIDKSSRLTGIENQIDLDFTENIDIYLDNFISAGILYTNDDLFKTDDKIYEVIKNQYISLERNIIGSIDETKYKSEIEIQKGFFDITNLGKKFINTCTQKIEKEYYVSYPKNIDGEKFKLGHKVSHKKIGIGVIVGINTDAEIIVNFKKEGPYLFKGNANDELEII